MVYIKKNTWPSYIVKRKTVVTSIWYQKATIYSNHFRSACNELL